MSLQKTEAYLEPQRASTMELFVNIFNSLLLKAPYGCSTGLNIGHQKYRNFQSEAKVEQITGIVTTRSVSCFVLRCEFVFVLL